MNLNISFDVGVKKCLCPKKVFMHINRVQKSWTEILYTFGVEKFFRHSLIQNGKKTKTEIFHLTYPRLPRNLFRLHSTVWTITHAWHELWLMGEKQNGSSMFQDPHLTYEEVNLACSRSTLIAHSRYSVIKKETHGLLLWVYGFITFFRRSRYVHRLPFICRRIGIEQWALSNALHDCGTRL